MRKAFWSVAAGVCTMLAVSCSSGSDSNKSGSSTSSVEGSAGDAEAASSVSTDPKGVGPIKEVKLNHPLDQKMVASGKSIYDVKCGSCHKVSEEKLVGPGWKGVTDRRTPEWIMNFAMNTEEMLSKDTAAQKMLEVCMVRMPNQSLAETDSRALLEFMLNNDGKK